MSYGLNVEMHKQTEICKRLDAIIRQVLPFLSGEVSQGGWEHWAVYITSPQSFIITFSYSLAY